MTAAAGDFQPKDEGLDEFPAAGPAPRNDRTRDPRPLF
jgi:hypothetical protein